MAVSSTEKYKQSNKKPPLCKGRWAKSIDFARRGCGNLANLLRFNKYIQPVIKEACWILNHVCGIAGADHKSAESQTPAYLLRKSAVQPVLKHMLDFEPRLRYSWYRQQVSRIANARIFASQICSGSIDMYNK